MNKKIIIPLLIISMLCFSVFPSDFDRNPISELSGNHFPKVALVLSGGAALGLAHIGVLKVLEEIGIPIDLVVGNSMGALVGGLYSSGYSPGDIEAIVGKINWNRILIDSGKSSSVSVLGGENSVFSIDLDEYGITSDEGVFDDQSICSLISNLTYRVSMIRNFDDLAIPFRALAVDLTNGREVVMSRGFLAQSMRASMGLPILFNPIEAYGGLLIDGGVLNNIPVDVAREQGADIIITVNVESLSVRNKEEIRNPIDIADQTMRIIFNTNNHRADIILSDILIIPDLSEYTRLDFHKYEELILLGEKAARSVKKDLELLAGNIRESRELEVQDPFRKGSYFSLPAPEYTGVLVDRSIDSTGLGAEIFDDSFESGFNLEMIEQCIYELSSTDTLRSIFYYLEPLNKVVWPLEEPEWNLIITGTPVTEGLHKLSMGMHFIMEAGINSNLAGDAYLDLLLRNLTGINSFSHTRLLLSFTKSILFESSYYHPIFHGIGLKPFFKGNLFFSEVNTYNTGNVLADYQRINTGLDLLFSGTDNFDFFSGYDFSMEWYNRLGTVEELGFGGDPAGRVADFHHLITAGTDWHIKTNSPLSRFGAEGKFIVKIPLPMKFKWSPFHTAEFDTLFYYTPTMDKTLYTDINAKHYRGEIENQWTLYPLGGADGLPGYTLEDNPGRDKLIIGVGYRDNLEILSKILGLETYFDSRIKAGNTWDEVMRFEQLLNLQAGIYTGLILETPVGRLSGGLGLSSSGTFAFSINFN